MGLDARLHHFEDFEEYNRISEAYEEELSALSDSLLHSTKTERERVAKREFLRHKYGVDEWGEPSGKTNIDLPSVKHPDHLFKIGYWRSSYNRAGFDHIVGTLTGKTLYDVVVGVDDFTYYIQPDWKAALEKAKDLLTMLRHRVEVVGDYQVMKVSTIFRHEDTEVDSDGKALDTFLQQMGKSRSNQAWSCEEGTFMPEGIQVFGIVNGIDTVLNSKVLANYIIFTSGEEGHTYDWYIHAAEIVVETIEYVLAQDDPEKYYLSWSS